MAIGLTPYLMFDGTARQAVDFYHSVLGGELTTTTFGEGMPPDQTDPATADRIMHASLFVSPRLHIMASDTIPGMGSATNGTISLSADGNDPGDAKVLQGYWDGLAAGGTVTLPLERAPWGDMFGQLTDKYGIEWMLDFPPED